jgi:hypothetical protein
MLVHSYRADAPRGVRRSSVATNALAGMAALVTWAFQPSQALAQCEPTWQSGDGVPGVLLPFNVTAADGSAVQGLATWDPDGPGPTNPLLIVGGLIEVAGSALVKNVAAWDGTAWSPMGQVEDWVSDVLVHNGEPYISLRQPAPEVGSTLTFKHRVLRWNGEGWQPVGIIGQSGYVYDLHVHEGELYAAGSFRWCGGVEVYRVARWDGLSWHAVGKGISSTKEPLMPGIVLQLGSFNGDVIAAGDFKKADGFPGDSIARWDGAEWVAMGEGYKGPIEALEVFQGKLHAGGLSGLASWDGAAWQKGGLIGVGKVHGLHAYGDALIVGGEFQTENPVIIKAWDGMGWSALGGSLRGDWVGPMAEYQGDLVAGGAVRYAVKDGTVVHTLGLAAWTPQVDQWRSLPNVALYTDGLVPKASVEWNGGLAVAGNFANTPDGYGLRVRHWTGGPASASVSLGTETFSVMLNNPMRLIEHHGELMASGVSLYINGLYKTGVARWTGQAWDQVGDNLGGIADVLSDNATLIAAGDLYSSKGGFSYSVAHLDGAQWLPLGDGLPETNGLRVASHQGQPVLHYSIGPSWNSQVKAFARFDGQAWEQLGPISNPDTELHWILQCHEIVSWKGWLLAAGYFKVDGRSCSMIRWDGDAWVPALPYVSGLGDVHIVGDRLFAMVYKGKGVYVIHQLIGDELVPFKQVQAKSGAHLGSLGNDLVLLGPALGTDGVVAMNWAHLACVCPADCDASGSLDIDDFICFQTAFVLGDPAGGADCDASGTLNIDDFVCFQTLFSLGC